MLDDPKAFLKNLPKTAGVYQMFDEHKSILYVGKAKNLAKRVASYFRAPLSPKTERLMGQVRDIQILQTHSETEALLLECDLIKKHKPRYNILLRDDKSYPYLVLTKHAFPRVAFYRGARKKGDHYFGPYPSTHGLRETIQLIQKVFLIRDCGDSYFSHRTRPCLQYQIKRCSAPCVGKISSEEYDKDVQAAVAFLRGKDEGVIARLKTRMEKAAKNMEYEAAAKLRDQIASIRHVQETQHVSNTQLQNVDVVAMAVDQQQASLNLLMIRGGHILGDKNFLLKLPKDDVPEDILIAFLSQHYLMDLADLPDALICDITATALSPFLSAISQKRHQKLKTFTRRNAQKQAWLEMAEKNAAFALKQQLLKNTRLETQFEALKKVLNQTIETIECFDVSHQQGEATVASDVFFNQEGPQKNAYRRFNIQNVTAGDDYAAMRQALTRRFKNTSRALPDILLIDGGKGQIEVAHQVLVELGLREKLLLLSISKGRARRADMDTILQHTGKAIVFFELPDAGRHLLQFARDEAHRFAISAHQKTKSKRTRKSFLENIPGVGAKRRKALIDYFGGLQGLKGKSVAEIAKVPGVSRALAEAIYAYLQK